MIFVAFFTFGSKFYSYNYSKNYEYIKMKCGNYLIKNLHKIFSQFVFSQDAGGEENIVCSQITLKI